MSFDSSCKLIFKNFIYIRQKRKDPVEIGKFTVQKKPNRGFCRAWKVTSNDIQDGLVSIDF
jgi:hypothetical protein